MHNHLFKGKHAHLRAMLAVGSVICLIILLTRIYLTSSFCYVFLSWNLFLAWIPLLLSGLINKYALNKSPWVISILLLTWLVFFPNAPYILTDLFHLEVQEEIPLWFDLILILSFAWNGLMLGFISLLEIQKFLNKIFTHATSWLLVIIALFLCSFGIYLGRYERWNSWDVLTNPANLIINITGKIINPIAHPQTIGVTMLFSLFLIVSYITLFILIKSKINE